MPEIPVSAEDAFEAIHIGRLIKGMMSTEGYTKVFVPHLERLKQKADAKCHNLKLRISGEHAIVEHNAIEKVLEICEKYIENMAEAIDYCKREDIQP